MFHRGPESLGGLGGDESFAAAANGCADHNGNVLRRPRQRLRGWRPEQLSRWGVEDGFDQEEIDAAGNVRADLVCVGGLDLVEGDDAEAGVVSVRRIGKRNGEGPDGPGHEALTSGCGRDPVGPFTALLRGLLVDLPGQVVEERDLRSPSGRSRGLCGLRARGGLRRRTRSG